jgi:putative ABC transport system substrate-binding protein
VPQLYEKTLREGLEALGWIDGRNIQIASRWSGGDTKRLRAVADELVILAPEVIVGGSTQVTTALKERTRTVPIVFVHVADPLAASLVQSLARPGGNITGFAAYESSIGGKWLELLKEAAPRIAHVLVLVDTQNPTWRMHVPTIEGVAPLLSVTPSVTHVSSAREVELAIQAVARLSNAGMIVLPGLLLDNELRELVVALAAKHGVPAIYGSRQMVASGGLMYYSSDWVDLYRRAASYVDQILKGAKPDELPVQQPTKFEFVVNLRTAKTLGITIQPALLARADEVIE